MAEPPSYHNNSRYTSSEAEPPDFRKSSVHSGGAEPPSYQNNSRYTSSEAEPPDFRKSLVHSGGNEYVFCTFILQQLFCTYNYPRELINIIMHKMYFHNEFRVFIGHRCFITGYNQLSMCCNYDKDLKKINMRYHSMIKTMYLSKHNICFITKKDQGYIRGANNCGQLASNNKDVHTMNANPRVFTNIKIMKCKNDFVIALNKLGTMKVWGNNSDGQLGLGTDKKKYYVPKKLPFTNITHADCGFYHTVFVTSDNNLYVTGSNKFGQLGLGFGYIDGTNVFVETRISEVVSVGCGMYHTIVLTKFGELYSSGRNNYGQLGLGDKRDQKYLRKIDLQDVLEIKVAYDHSIAICTNGDIYIWGQNLHGRLGLDDTINKLKPTKLSINNLKSIHCDMYYTLMIMNDNTYNVHTYYGGVISDEINKLK